MNLCFKGDKKWKRTKKTTDNKKSKKVYYVPTEPVHTIPVAKSCIGISVEKIKEMKKSGDTYYIV